MNAAADNDPLYSRESENALIAALFSESAEQAFTTASLRINAEQFHSEEGRRTFLAVQELVIAGEPLDPTLVANRIKGAVGFSDTVRQALEQAAATPFHPEHVERYVQVIAEKWQARQMQQGMQAIQEALPQVGSGVTPEEVAAKLNSLSMAVTAKSSRMELLDDAQANLTKLVVHLERKQDGTIAGVSSGIEELDTRLGPLEPGQLIVIAGRPGMGKTVKGLQYANHHGLRGDLEADGSLPLCAVFSLEMETPKLMLRTAAAEGRIDHERLRRGELTDEDFARLTAFMAKYQHCNIHIDPDATLTPGILRSKLRVLEQQTGKKVRLVVIDYLQLMGADRAYANRVEAMGEITRSLKQTAKDFQCPVIALAQLNRGVEQRADKRPMVSDLRESGSIEQDADTIILLYRDEYYNPDSQDKGMVEIIVGKARDTVQCMVPAQFLGQYQCFDNMRKGAYGYDSKYGD